MPGETYRRPRDDVHPPRDLPGYRGTALRHPRQPLVIVPQTLSELTGPVYGHASVTAEDRDLTNRGRAEPIGERIVVEGRVIDEDGRPVRDSLVELWQANAAGRYAHRVDRHDAPLDPNFTGAGRVSVAQPLECVAAGAHPLLTVGAELPHAARDADVLSRRSAARARSDLQQRARSARARTTHRQLRSLAHRARASDRLSLRHRPARSPRHTNGSPTWLS